MEALVKTGRVRSIGMRGVSRADATKLLLILVTNRALKFQHPQNEEPFVYCNDSPSGKPSRAASVSTLPNKVLEVRSQGLMKLDISHRMNY